jgi:metal-responsive CopG/Arc/MetJ family transcriptional regulator
MAKVNISLPDELLDEVDSLAQELDESRSGFVREATVRYVATVRSESEERRRREQIERALASARALADSTHADGESAESIVRRDRDSDYGNRDDG